MLAKLRPRLTYANVMSTLAAFFALAGGSAYAINEWTGANIKDETLTGADVKGKLATSNTPAVNGTILTQDVGGQPSHPNGTPFLDGTLTQWDIKNNSLTAADLAPSSVDASEIKDPEAWKPVDAFRPESWRNFADVNQDPS